MKSDLELLARFIPEKTSLIRARIVAEDKKYEDPTQVLEAFLGFAGEGWLCTSESAKVYRLPEDQPGKDEYPLHGERSGGALSMHLRQDGVGGWILTTLEESPSESGSLCIEAQLAACGDGGSLLYQVCHEPVITTSGQMENLTELRPVRARFVGFAAKT